MEEFCFGEAPVMDSLSWNVMNATADDWESLEQILPHVRRYHGPVESAEVAELISRLVHEGLMEEMRNPVINPAAVVADPVEFWFRMTLRGRMAWESESYKHRDEE
jgi:hypothetical protein